MLILHDSHGHVSSPDDIARMLQGWLKTVDALDREKEHLIAIHFNTRLVVKQVDVVSVGIVNASMVHPREVYRRAIVAGSVSIVVAHNHPSGNCEPSSEDLTATQRLQSVGETIGIKLIDHIIFSDTDFFSLRQHGLI